MELSRREILKLALFGVTEAVLPLGLEAIAGKTEKPEVSVEFYIQRIEGDKLSDSFYRDKNTGLWKPIAKNIEGFFNGEFESSVRFRDYDSFDKSELARNHIAFEYETIEKMVEEPEEIIYAIGGQTSLDELEKTIKEIQKKSGLKYEKVRTEFLDRIKKGLKNKFGKGHGLGSPYSHRCWITPSPTVYAKSGSDREMANAYSCMMCHELGHALGLKHPSAIGKFDSYGRRNFMNERQEPRTIFDFNLDMHPEQVLDIKRYLETGKTHGDFI